MSSTQSTYPFDNDTRDAADQVQLLAKSLDPHSLPVLRELELPAGARCADLGPGAGTVAHWLASRVGPHGEVVGYDLNPRHVPDHPQISLRVENLNTATFAPASFDLIHGRLITMHLSRREDLVARAAKALKPGGVLVLSEWATDHLDDTFLDGPDEIRDVFTLFQHTMIGVCEANGMDSTWARRLPAVARDAGLRIADTATYNKVWAGGEPGMLLHASNSRQLEKPLLAAGMSAAQLGLLRDAMTDPQILAWAWPMHTTVAVRPPR